MNHASDLAKASIGHHDALQRSEGSEDDRTAPRHQPPLNLIEVEKERELHSIITKSMAEGICLVRLSDGAIVYANPKFERLFGYEPGELNGQPVSRLNYAEQQGGEETVYEEIVQAVVERGEATYEVQNVKKDGTSFWCQATTSTFEHPDYGVVLVAVQQDITQRKLAEAEIYQLNAALAAQVTQRTAQLALSNQRYANLTQLSPVGIFCTSATGECLYVNDRWCEITGLTPEDVQAHGWAATLHPDDHDLVFQEWQQTLQTHAPFQLEYRFQRSDGKLTWVFGQAIPETDGQGAIVGYIGTITDITARKATEQALQESEQRYATLAQLSPAGIFRADPQGNCLYVNDRWCQIAGLTQQHAIGAGWQQSIHPADLAAVNAEGQRVAAANLPFRMEFRFLRPNGETSWVMCQAVPEYTASGEIAGYIGTVTDITDRKATEAALQERAAELTQLNLRLTNTAALLEERNQELDQFAYIASHDLKAPLRAIANLSAWIEEDLAEQLPPENQKQLQLLRDRVRRMDNLIDGLLQFSRVGRNQAPVECIDLNQLFADILDSLAPPATFTIQVPPNLPALTTRGLRLQQVLTNLICNAIKHHDRPDGTVTVSLADQGTVYEFAIADDGPGIAPQHHDRIFEVFHTLDPRDTKANTGVGLAIVKKVVEAEGGKISVQSDIGQGTTFRFTWLKQATVVNG